MRNWLKYLCIVLSGLIFLIILSSSAYAWDENLTFQAFYSKSPIDWLKTVGIALVIAIGAALIIYFSGGTGGPMIVTIGTWIGKAAGLSGIAATNYGLALIGGGSIASGGLAILGGTAILAAALSFTSDVVIDYTLSKSLEVYDKSAFMERAKTLPVLPLPRNDRGSKLYEDIIETINKQYDSSKPQFDESNQRVITAGINLALNYQDLKTHEELGQIYTLLSLLYLNAGNYDNSYYYAQHAISEVRIANTDRKSNISITLPHALLAITSLSKGDVDVSWSIDHLKYAIENEKDNDLIPFTLSVFVDRLMLRLDKMKPSHLVRIQNITVRTERKYRTQANQALLVKSLVMTKKEQDFIRIVTSISPESIQCDLAKSKLKTSLNDYSDYLYVAKTCLNDVSSDEKFLKDPENKKPLLDLNRTIGQYEGYHTQLESFVSNYQCKVSVQ